MEDLKVAITRSPYDNECGIISISEIQNVRWDSMSGGVNRRQAGYSLYGYVKYALAAKLVKCSGRHNYGYNDAKICIPATLNKGPEYIKGYKMLCDQAGPKPQGEIRKHRPQGGLPCTKRILRELDSSYFVTRKDLRDTLHSEGYQIQTIRNAINSLKKQSKITTEGSSSSPKQIIKRINTEVKF